jgi:hypothetical protein
MTQRITLMLEDSEMVALRQAARKELRKPRDHARFLLRAMLDGPLFDGNSCCQWSGLTYPYNQAAPRITGRLGSAE